MTTQQHEGPKPNLSPWFPLRLCLGRWWPAVFLVAAPVVVVWVWMSLIVDPRQHAQIEILALALVLWLLPWYLSLTHWPKAAEPPAPPLRGPRDFPQWYYIAVPLFVLLHALDWVLGGRGAELGRWWPLWMALIIAGSIALVELTLRRGLGPLTPAFSPLREALEKAGWPTKLTGASPMGHATMLITTSGGPELVWFIDGPRTASLPPYVVHLMWRHLVRYSLPKGWVLTHRGFSRELAAYSESFGIRIAPPQAIGAWDSLPTPAPVESLPLTEEGEPARSRRQEAVDLWRRTPPLRRWRHLPPTPHAPLGGRFTNGRPI